MVYELAFQLAWYSLLDLDRGENPKIENRIPGL